jgi:hypothetical protein
LRLGLEQAARYDHTKPPLLVVKERYRHESLVVMRLADFVDLLGPLTESMRQDKNPSKRVL